MKYMKVMNERTKTNEKTNKKDSDSFCFLRYFFCSFIAIMMLDYIYFTSISQF